MSESILPVLRLPRPTLTVWVLSVLAQVTLLAGSGALPFSTAQPGAFREEDNGDNLYRSAPLRADVVLDYRTGNWKHALDARLVAEQVKVSAYNGETASSGYGLLNLRTTWQATKGTTLAAGVENLFDKYYAHHLGGINRVASSDVPVGGHIPGAGRFAYIAGEYRW